MFNSHVRMNFKTNLYWNSTVKVSVSLDCLIFLKESSSFSDKTSLSRPRTMSSQLLTTVKLIHQTLEQAFVRSTACQSCLQPCIYEMFRRTQVHKRNEPSRKRKKKLNWNTLHRKLKSLHALAQLHTLTTSV